MASQSSKNDVLGVLTPLGFVVRATARYWTTIVSKHPDLANRLDQIRLALSEPDEVRRSRRDPAVFLFYRGDAEPKRWVVAVAKHESGDGFLVTAYRADAIKEGERIWPK